MDLLKTIKKFVLRLLGYKAKLKTTAKRSGKKTETGAAHYYFGDLLDRMDSAFQDFRLLRSGDPDVYDLTKRWGATVCSSDGIIIGADIDRHFLDTMPAFGCFHMPDKDTEKTVGARFLYFVKESKPVNVHHQVKVISGAGRTAYRCGAIYDWYGAPVLSEFYVGVGKNDIIPLKVCRPVRYMIASKNKRRHQDGTSVFARMEWDYPAQLKDFAADNNKTVEQLVIDWFSIAANLAYTREAGMTVTARKGGEAVAFSIDMLRTPYFFADRQKVVNENGKTKPIIHHVKGHWRTLAGGEQKFIKPHFRGLREFDWNGYSVRVGMAGWHGVGLSSWDVASVDHRTSNANLVGADEVAEKVDRLLA